MHRKSVSMISPLQYPSSVDSENSEEEEEYHNEEDEEEEEEEEEKKKSSDAAGVEAAQFDFTAELERERLSGPLFVTHGTIVGKEGAIGTRGEPMMPGETLSRRGGSETSAGSATHSASSGREREADEDENEASEVEDVVSAMKLTTISEEQEEGVIDRHASADVVVNKLKWWYDNLCQNRKHETDVFKHMRWVFGYRGDESISKKDLRLRYCSLVSHFNELVYALQVRRLVDASHTDKNVRERYKQLIHIHETIQDAFQMLLRAGRILMRNDPRSYADLPHHLCQSPFQHMDFSDFSKPMQAMMGFWFKAYEYGVQHELSQVFEPVEILLEGRPIRTTAVRPIMDMEEFIYAAMVPFEQNLNLARLVFDRKGNDTTIARWLSQMEHSTYFPIVKPNKRRIALRDAIWAADKKRHYLYGDPEVRREEIICGHFIDLELKWLDLEAQMFRCVCQRRQQIQLLEHLARERKQRQDEARENKSSTESIDDEHDDEIPFAGWEFDGREDEFEEFINKYKRKHGLSTRPSSASSTSHPVAVEGNDTRRGLYADIVPTTTTTTTVSSSSSFRPRSLTDAGTVQVEEEEVEEIKVGVGHGVGTPSRGGGGGSDESKAERKQQEGKEEKKTGKNFNRNKDRPEIRRYKGTLSEENKKRGIVECLECGTDVMRIKTEAFDRILSVQEFPAEVVSWTWMFIGRLLFDLKELEDWQVALMLVGLPAVGKSTFITAVANMFNPKMRGYLGEYVEEKFPLEGVYRSQVVFAYEMGEKTNLRFTDWSKMIEGSQVTVLRKGKVSVDIDQWKQGCLFAMNKAPKFRGSAGAALRRQVKLPFLKRVKRSITNLDAQCAYQLPAQLVKSTLTYHAHVDEYKGINIWDVLPEFFTREQQHDLLENNTLARFLHEPEWCILERGAKTPWKDFHLQYKAYLEEEKLSRDRNEKLTRENYQFIFERFDLKVADCTIPGSDGAGIRTAVKCVVGVRLPKPASISGASSSYSSSSSSSKSHYSTS